ncbi:MAG TPA: RNA methyltransferase [Devosiaceae bacterium]|jgi:23S rRNA (uracil1939-C5)-methyltransferase
MPAVAITGLGQRGEGVAEVDGKRLYVPLTLPGDRAEIAIEGDRGSLVTLLEEGPGRTQPFCPHFGECGGCQLQHMDAGSYTAFKQGLVETPLRFAGIEIAIDPLVDAKGTGRRRATLHARREGSGFMHMRSHQVHDLDRCPILVPALAKAAEIARGAFAAIGECDVSLTATLTGIDVAIRAEKKGLKATRLTPLAQRFDLARLTLNGDMLLQNRQPLVQMGKAQVPLPSGSFLQATEAAEETLAALVLAPLKGARSVADLFCGAGPFALRIAEGARVLAADSDKAGIAALAQAHRQTQGLKVITAQVRDLFREPLTIFELNGIDAVVFDPPRAGAEAQTRELARSKIKTVVAVSCDPKTFARDAAILIAGGYRLERLTPVDQFAWSAHVELVGVFRR